MTQSTVRSTICVSGWTATVRPDSYYTTSLKERQLASGYAWHHDRNIAEYEEDHLIPLELGGAPSAAANLWPEPYAADRGATSKDAIENKLHDLVCAGNLKLCIAQRAIARNWVVAARRYGDIPVTPSAPRHPAPAPAPVSSSAAGHTCTTTSSGSCIRGGQFCPASSYGDTVYDAEGRAYTCTGDASRPHWQ